MMATFGEELRTERERREISLETLCAQTRVQQKYVEALENDDFGALPGGVFRKGIVRAYLTATGLDEADWMPRFEQGLEADARSRGVDTDQKNQEWATFAENVRRNRVGAGRRNSFRWLGILLLLFVLAAAAWATWHYLIQPKLQLY